MNLSNIGTSLGMSKKLDEAGFKADTCFWWTKVVGKWEVVIEKLPLISITNDGIKKVGEVENYPAYTFQQLWEVLPNEIEEVEAYKLLEFEGIQYRTWDADCQEEHVFALFHSQKRGIADAAAEAVLWCIEEGYFS